MRTLSHYQFCAAHIAAHWGVRMGLKAMAEAALQQCAPRTIDRTLDEVAPAHCTPQTDTPRTLSDGEKSALAIAERAIARAALTDEQKASRLDDLLRDPAIAKFWAMAWPANESL